MTGQQMLDLIVTNVQIVFVAIAVITIAIATAILAIAVTLYLLGLVGLFIEMMSKLAFKAYKQLSNR